MTQQVPSPVHIAETFGALVETMIPGNEVFPSASAVGTHALVLDRVRDRLGSEGLTAIVRALDGDIRFVDANTEQRITAVRHLEINEPALFRVVRFSTYFAYYERPPVIAALQSLGYDYNDSPQPLGYAMQPFDPKRHVPAEPRGSYKPTMEITRLDLSSLSARKLPAGEH